MPSHHIIITGTGRAGTTFLVQLLTSLGLDTGFSGSPQAIDPNCNAGLEWDLREPNAPYIVKSPWLCDYLDELLEQSEIVIDHAILPVRDLFAAAESRRSVANRTESNIARTDIPGGLWHTTNPAEQEAVLTHQLYKIIHTLVKRDIPLTFLYFPRLIHDPRYVHQKLEFLFSDLSYGRFLESFQRTVKPEFVHNFRNERRNAAS